MSGAGKDRVFRMRTEAKARRLTLSALPPAILEQSRVRLSWLAGAAIAGSLAIAPLASFLQPELAAVRGTPVFRGALAATILASLAVIAAELARKKIPAAVVVLAGLVYEVFISAAIALFENLVPWHAEDFIRGGSSLTLWLAAFALLVPVPPRQAVAAALLSAACGPAVHYALSPALGLPLAPMHRIVIFYLPPFLMAIAAGLINARVLRLEWDAAHVRELGSYQLEGILARGGMGEIWRARHRLLKRPAAVKLIRPEAFASGAVSAAALRQRFEQEAHAISLLRSPHTVEIYDFGVTEDGGLYFAMELLEGLDLGELVNRFGPQPAGRVIHILMQACESLEEAHAKGMVHRDIKPTNFFLCRLGATCDFVKLLDFGLVKRFLAGQENLLTVEGTAVGTPAFMAPELALGEKRIDGRTDIYGLGCAAFWLLTGRTVFVEDNPTAMALAHVQKEPEPPSRLTEVEVPAQLDALVLECLAKKPEARPPSASELKRRLRLCAAAAPWDAEDAERWWRTNLPAPAVAPEPAV